MKSIRRFPFYAFLIASFPTLHVYSLNASCVPPSELIRPLAVAFGLTAIFLAAGWIAFRSAERAGVAASPLLFVALSYGYGPRVAAKTVNRALHPLIGSGLAQQYAEQLWLVLGVVLLVAAIALLVRTRSNLGRLAQFLAVMSLALVVMPLMRIASCKAVAGTAHRGDPGWAAAIESERMSARGLRWPSGKPLPDIYFIILDMYSRNDVLRDYFGYDNRAFTDYLTNRGFLVAPKSRANYAWTRWSLPAALNYDYLSPLVSRFASRRVWKKDPPLELIWNSKAARVLRDKGYLLVFLDSGWYMTAGSPYADLRLPPRGVRLTEMERVLIERSAFSLLRPRYLDGFLRKRTVDEFAELETISRLPQPTFTFAHIACPHYPWVFDRNGNMPVIPERMSDEQRRRLYTDQLIYVNQLARRTLDTIIRSSRVPPIIILQSDHGLAEFEFERVWGTPHGAKLSDAEIAEGFSNRLRNLNALYLQGKPCPAYYDDITSVNTFRVLFNACFGGHYELLRDTCYIPRRGQWVENMSFRRLREYDPR